MKKNSVGVYFFLEILTSLFSSWILFSVNITKNFPTSQNGIGVNTTIRYNNS